MRSTAGRSAGENELFASNGLIWWILGSIFFSKIWGEICIGVPTPNSGRLVPHVYPGDSRPTRQMSRPTHSTAAKPAQFLTRRAMQDCVLVTMIWLETKIHCELRRDTQGFFSACPVILSGYSIITFRVSCRRREMYCGHARLCVSVSVCPRPHAYTIALTRM